MTETHDYYIDIELYAESSADETYIRYIKEGGGIKTYVCVHCDGMYRHISIFDEEIVWGLSNRLLFICNRCDKFKWLYITL